MDRLSTELKVGLLILSGVLLAVYASVAVTGWRPGQKDTYTLFASFENASGLLPGSPVQVAGVRVGKVNDITLDGNEALVRMSVYSRYIARSDSEATIRSLGILGDKYIDLKLGSSVATPLPDKGYISLVGPNAGLESILSEISQIVDDVGSVTGAFRAALGGERGRKRMENIVENISLATADISRIASITNQQIDYILFNLREFTSTVNRITKENEAGIRRAVSGFSRFAERLASIAEKNLNEIDSIIRNIAIFSTSLAQDGPSITGDLRLLLANNREKLGETVENLNDAFIRLDDAMINVQSISAKLDEGEGTFGQLLNEDTTVNSLNSALAGASDFFGNVGRLKLDVGGHVEYLSGIQGYKSFLDLRLSPLKDRFYEIQLVKDPRGATETTETETTENGIVSQKKEIVTTEEMELSLKIGQRYYDTIIQGGLLENSFGLSAEQLFGRRDQLTLGLSIWDLDRQEGTHLKLFSIWRAFSNAFIIFGKDDAINNNASQVNNFVGVGIHFNEDSLRPLMGTISSQAGQ